MAYIRLETSQKREEPPEVIKINTEYQSLLKQEEAGEIGIEEFVFGGFRLAAKKYDLRGKQLKPRSHFLKSLNELLLSPKVKETYELGLGGSLSLDNNEKAGIRINRISNLLQQIFPGTDLVQITFAQKITGDNLNSAHSTRNHLDAINKYLKEANAPDKLQALLHLISLREIAYLQMKKLVTRLFEPGVILHLQPKMENDFWLRRLIGENTQPDQEGISFCHGYRERLLPYIENLARNLYQEDTDLAIELWNIFLFMKSDRYHASDAPALMQSLTSSLVNGDFHGFLNSLKIPIVKYPEMFSEKQRNSLKRIFANEKISYDVKQVNHRKEEFNNIKETMLRRAEDTSDEAHVQLEQKLENLRTGSYLIREEVKENGETVIHLKAISVIRESVTGKDLVTKEVRIIDKYDRIRKISRKFRIINYRVYSAKEIDNNIRYFLTFKGHGAVYAGELLRLISNENPETKVTPLYGAELAYLKTAVLFWNINLDRYEIISILTK